MTPHTTRRSRALVLLALPLIGSSAAPDPGDQVISAAAIKREIKAKGPDQVLRQLYEDPDQWAEVLESISKAKPSWLWIAATLYRASDAGSAEEIQLAVADAVERDPAAVLAILGRPFEVQAICGNGESLGRDYQQAIDVLQRRRAALVRVTEKAVQQEKKRCIDALDALTKDVEAHRRDWFAKQ